MANKGFSRMYAIIICFVYGITIKILTQQQQLTTIN